MAINRNLTYGLMESLGEAIVTGHYEGRPFPIEAELEKQYGASRSAVREAVKMLTAKGLLRARPRQGTLVEPESQWNLFDPDVLRWMLERKFSLDLLRKFTQMRLAIEPSAAALVAMHANPEALQPIHDGLARMRAAQQGDDDPLAADIAFHVSILDATGNPFFAHLRELVATALRISIRFTNRIAGHTASVDDHQKVLRAIEARNPERASKMMRELIEEVLELIDQAER